MTTEELLAKVEALEKEVQRLKDIEEIKYLQRAYGFYLENWMGEDLADLFVDSPDAVLKIAAGQFVGSENIRIFFRHGMKDVPHHKSDNPEFKHQVMQLQGVVDVAPDGKTARGRWYGFGANAFPHKDGVSPNWMGGTYLVEYVKDNGIWKLKEVHWCMAFNATYGGSWVKPDRRKDNLTDRPHHPDSPLGKISLPPAEDALYPSGYIPPFHFKNPVSGRATEV
jgi:hypothetical protein